MRFTLLIFSFAVRNYFQRTFVANGKTNSIYDGCDHRFFIKTQNISELTNTTFTNINLNVDIMTLEEINRFNSYFYKLKLLKNLMSPSISEIEKLQHLEIYEGYNNKSKYAIDLTAGGLYKDWDTNLD